MSYIFSRALVAASLQGKCSGTDASALLSGNPTPPLFLPSDKTTAFSRLSRFGMTFGHLTDEHGAELLTSWLAGFPVRTSALQEKAQASPAPAAECGATWRASLAKFDPASSSWKTVQLSLLGDLELSSVTWPRSGMTAGGQCWELPMLGPITSGTDSGLWLPTPTASSAGTNGKRKCPETGAWINGKPSLPTMATQNKWPTPRAMDGKGAATYESAKGCLARGFSPNLSEAVLIEKYQTPVSRMSKDNGKNPSELLRNSPTSAMQAGGRLNPMWVEWLMGWPLGWTDLKPLATDKSHCALPQHSECLQQVFEVTA